MIDKDFSFCALATVVRGSISQMGPLEV